MDEIDLTLRKEFWDAKPSSLVFNDTARYNREHGYVPYFNFLEMRRIRRSDIYKGYPNPDPDQLIVDNERIKERNNLRDWEYQFTLLGRCDEYKWFIESNYGSLSFDYRICDCCGCEILPILKDSVKASYLCIECEEWSNPNDRGYELI